MSSHSYLHAGDEFIYNWPYSFPPINDPILSFLFSSSDKVIEKEEVDDDEGYYSLMYRTTVKEAKERLDLFGYTIESLDNTIAMLTDIPVNRVDFALLDDEEFFEMHSDEEKEEALYAEADKYDEIIRHTEFGNLLDLRRIRKILESCKPDDIVELDTSQISSDKSHEELEAINLITNSATTSIRIDKKYLLSAKVHFSQANYDLVYIELIIALENALQQYVKTKLAAKTFEDFGIPGMLKDLSLIGTLKFCVAFFALPSITLGMIKDVEIVYNKRNNIIHNGARKYNRANVYKAIVDSEKLITELR